MMAAKAVSICGKMKFEKLANTPRIETTRMPERNNTNPCLTPLRRGETGTGSSGFRYTGRFPPLLNNCKTPSRGKPQREQKRITPATCCWPHCGQNMGTVPRQTGCYVALDNSRIDRIFTIHLVNPVHRAILSKHSSAHSLSPGIHSL